MTKKRGKVDKKYKLTKSEKKRLTQLQEKEDYTIRELDELAYLEEKQYERIAHQNKKAKSKKKKSNGKAPKRNQKEQMTVKNRLFLECGTVDMYDMLIYEKRSLTLHHDPPFRQTHHTVIEESFLLTRENHDHIEELARTDRKAYKEVMNQIRANKEALRASRMEKINANFDSQLEDIEDARTIVDGLTEEEREELRILLKKDKEERKVIKAAKKRERREANTRGKKRNKEEQRLVKNQLLLKCGTVDMYDMEEYDEKKLTLHHDPPFRYTHHTVFEESFLLTRKNHDYVELQQSLDPDAYQETMDQIRANKEILIRRKLPESNDSKHE